MRSKYILASLIVALFACTGLAAAELVAVAGFGYHPESHKQVISYTSASSGTATVYTSAGAQVMTVPLAKAKDYNGNTVNCQGNNPCLVADVSSLGPGTYYAVTGFGGRSPEFVVSNTVYQQQAPVFLEFFNAQLQQGSAYHADKHAGYQPQFNVMADGSFLMEADQAAITLIRLGSAYRENPQLFATDRYTVYAAGKPDMQEYIRSYVEYLKGLQGVRVQETTSGNGFRLDRGIKIENAFVPGPTSRTSLDVYIPGSPPTKLQTVPLRSLCAGKSGAAYSACIDFAATYYKCQVDEPCLNITYVDRTGVVSYQPGDYAVSTGWSYEFGCYFDIHISEEQYEADYNPCMLFRPETSESYTVHTLLAYLEALPAINAYSPSEGQQLFERAVDTYEFVQHNYVLDSDEQAFLGAAEFLLYDYTGNVAYLRAAHSMRGGIDKQFISDRLEGNEYYWEEYIRHRAAIESNGLPYAVGGENPEEFFRGKMWGDWKDLGNERSISRTGERVFQFDNNIQFHNSRFMLTEGLLAAKTNQLHPAPESFIQVIADSQLAWLTGQNAVQLGTGSNPPIDSVSFIFGIGDFPAEQHSRFFVDSGYASATAGRIVGARGTSYQFHDGTGYVYLDGTATILGHELGSLGNQYRGESYNEPFDLEQTFSNGKSYIPGWINGAFDIREDLDIIMNYRDTTDTYENTETTNEIVATAVELIAYLDSERNSRPRAAMPTFTYTGSSCTPATEVCDSVDNDCDGQTDEGGVCGSTCSSSVQTIPVTCSGTIASDEWDGCRKVLCTAGGSSIQALACDKGSGFEVYRQFSSGNTLEICFGSTCISSAGFAAGTLPYCAGGSTCTPSTETCDSKDNDCDGQVDEGVCAPTCTPTTEVCDSADNDCDGQVDENNVCSGSTCATKVSQLEASCVGGTITSDSGAGCRTIVCTNGGDSLKAMACDKGDHFELYRQTRFGSSVKEICLGTTCVGSSGFASSDYPVCSDGPSCTPSTEVCDSADNDCDGQVDEGVCAPTCTPSAEVCDAADNDCDGQADENGVCGSAESCYDSVKDAPVSCERGSITADSWNGCRTVECGAGANSLQVLACDKGGHFELYRQTRTGSGAKICLGATCIDGSGFARSDDFPVCGAEPPSCTPEVCDSADNDCDGSTDEGDVCATGAQASVSVAPWYPKGRDYIFRCAAENDPVKYEWHFGDGEKNLFGQADVYHKYAAAGTYMVTCNAVGASSVSGAITITVQ